jgi:hypothetical protein
MISQGLKTVLQPNRTRTKQSSKRVIHQNTYTEGQKQRSRKTKHKPGTQELILHPETRAAVHNQ